MNTAEEHGLLEGLRVVELGGGISVPLVGLLLAEQGAEVVRIATPGDDPVLDAILSRNKMEIEVDWNLSETRTQVEALLARADVVIHSEALSFDLERLRDTQNKGLISCRVAAFPHGDPRASMPGFEAIAGMAGFLFNKPIGLPYYHDFAIGSVMSALYSAIGIVAALIARERVGRGQRVNTSYFESSLNAQVLQILFKAGIPRGFMPLRMVGSPFMRVWKCADGEYVYLHITMPKHNRAMLRLLDQNGYAAEVAQIRELMSEQTEHDPSQVGSIAEAKQLKAIYAEIFLSKPAKAWEDMLGNDLCCIKVRRIEEWLEDSKEAGMTDATTIEDPVFGELTVPGPLVVGLDHPPQVKPRETGELDALVDAWQSTEVWEAKDVEAIELRHPLQGMRVVDLSRIIAGPAAARVLAELGAEVVSIQSETRLDWALSFHLIFNAGKKSVTLDFTTEEGKDALWKLLDNLNPDVFLHNYRHLELARAIGVGPEQVLARYPSITYTHLNAYGNNGIWKDRPGFEQVVQAVSGIQVGYARGGRPKLLPSPVIDIGCGLLGAFGSLLGLYNRKRKGKGAVLTTHLTNVAVLLQLPKVSAFQRGACIERARERGNHVIYRPEEEVVADILLARGRPVCVAGRRADLQRWLGRPAEDELALLRRKLALRSIHHWRRSLRRSGLENKIGLMPQPKIGRIIEEIRKIDHRAEPAVYRRDYPGSPQPLAYIKNPIRLSRTPIRAVEPPPVRGTHTHEMLHRIGREVPPNSGVFPYPPNKSLPSWLLSFVRWGYFAWKSGNI